MKPLVNLAISNSKIGAIQPKILDDKNPEYFEYAGASGGYIDKYGYPYCRGRIFNTLEKDEGNRPETNLEGLTSLVPVYGEGKFITAGNASQLSDGSASVVVMESKVAENKGLTPLGYYRGMAVAINANTEKGNPSRWQLKPSCHKW